MSKNTATKILAAHYAQTFSTYGANAAGVDWGSQEKHRLRLQSMVRQVGAEAMGVEGVLDVGCGYGELLNVLYDSFRVRPTRYVGVDPCLPMIEAARVAHPGYQFEAVSFEDFIVAQPIHHLFCCGVFTKKVHASDEEMYALLDALLGYGKKAEMRTITFNTMSPLCDVRPAELFFPDLDRIVTMLLNHWGYAVRKFSFASEYLQYEMLVKIEI